MKQQRLTMRNQLTHLTRLGILLAVGLIPVEGQLHLITGSPTPKEDIGYASALLRVQGDGTLQPVATLAAGTEWISISYSWRKILVLPRYPDNRIKVVDFDKAAVVKECVDPPGPVGGLVDQWLIDSPSKGPVFVEYLIGDDIKHGQLRGMIMDPSVACDKSFVFVDPSESRFYVTHGTAGLWDMGGASSMTAYIQKDGRVSTWISSVTTYLDSQVPESLLAGVGKPGGAISVNNDRALVLGVGDGDDASNQRLLLFRKRDRVWHRIPVSGHIAWTRGFGAFIAVAEAHTKNEQHRESAGRDDWRKARSAHGPHVQGKFLEASVIYPGRLHLYNVDSEKLYTIVTRQGDSEVLLVEGNDVYYRVSDRLYKAKITDVGISADQLLVTADQIRDVHWAFMKPSK